MKLTQCVMGTYYQTGTTNANVPFTSSVALFSFLHARPDVKERNVNSSEADSLDLAKMIEARENAMITKDIVSALSQFSEDATWINSQGYFFEGKDSILNFHKMLVGRDSLDYYYEASVPRIRLLDTNNALVYYSWKMFWFKTANPVDTVYKEIGLMTLNAVKHDTAWRWIAVTNQHTPWFYKEINNVSIE